jgi:hypothetical protein
MFISPRLMSLAFTWFRALQHCSRGYALAEVIFSFYMRMIVHGYGMSRLLSSGDPLTFKRRTNCWLRVAGQNCPFYCCPLCCTKAHSEGRSLRDSPPMGNVLTTLSASSPDSGMFYLQSHTDMSRKKINQILFSKASTILVDLGSFLTRAVSISKSMVGDDTGTRERTAEVLRSFLQVLLTPGLNPDIDTICKDRLGLPATQASVGFHRFGYCLQQHQGCTLT